MSESIPREKTTNNEVEILQVLSGTLKSKWMTGAGGLTALSAYMHCTSRIHCRNGQAVLTAARPAPRGRLTSEWISMSETLLS